jgi:hypothetical protein
MQCDYLGPIKETEGRTHFEAKFLSEGVACGEVHFSKGPGHA